MFFRAPAISSGMLTWTSFHNHFSRSMTNHFLRTLTFWYTIHHHNKNVSLIANGIASSYQEHLTLTNSVKSVTDFLGCLECCIFVEVDMNSWATWTVSVWVNSKMCWFLSYEMFQAVYIMSAILVLFCFLGKPESSCCYHIAMVELWIRSRNVHVTKVN